jgi:hypothetical protein
MRHRRTQQTSILDYVGSNASKVSTSTQTNREAPINFTASYRGSTQSRADEGDEAGDEVDSEEEGEGRLDRFRLDHRKTRLDTEELEEPTFEGEAARTRDRKRQGKKKVLVDVDSEEDIENDQPRRGGPQRRKDTADLPPQSSSQAREAIDAITIDVPSSSSSRSESPRKSTVSPAVRRRRRSGVVLSGTSSSQHASNQEQEQDHDDDPLRTPTSTQERPHRVPKSHSASKRKRRLVSDDNSDIEDLGRPGPGPSTSTNNMTRSATRRKTRSGGPVTPTPPSPLASDAQGAHARTRKKARQVDYYESDDPMDLLSGKKGSGKGKGKMREDLDDAVFEAETSLSPSQSQSVGRKTNTALKTGVGNARQTRSTKRRGISVDMEDVATHPPAGRPTTKLKIFSSESESESESGAEPETAVKLRGWSSTPSENSGSDESHVPQKQRRNKGKDPRRKKARVQDPDDSEEDEIDPKELLEEIAMDEPGESILACGRSPSSMLMGVFWS